MRRFAGLPPDLKEGSNDLRLYRAAGEALVRGEIPYRDFFIEYPPGTLPFFVPPALFSEEKTGYINLFAGEMALVLVAALILTALAARRIYGPRAWPVPAATLALGAVMLYPVAVTRYDAVVALTLAVAAACAARSADRGAAAGYGLLAYAVLGVGAAAKLVPALATLPLALFGRGAARGYAVFFGVLALFFAPALALGGDGFLESFEYHADRGLQVESVAASVLMALGRVGGVVFEHGAFEVRGPGVGLALSLSAPVTVVLLVVTALAGYRERRSGGFGAGAFPRYAAALILAFMLGSKVLSPQYAVWLLPLVPLGFGGLAGVGVSALFLAACFATTQVFPVHYVDLLNGSSPGPQLLLLRNGLLALLWGALLFVPGGPSEKATP